MKGKFIVFEGPNCCGKSTQIRKLSENLDEADIKHIKVKALTETILSEHIHKMLCSYENHISKEAMMYLMVADRIEVWNKKIKPALDTGLWVLCDRWIESTFAYQCGFDRNLRDQLLSVVGPRGGNIFYPDATIMQFTSYEKYKERWDSRNLGDAISRERHEDLTDLYNDMYCYYHGRSVIRLETIKTVDERAIELYNELRYVLGEQNLPDLYPTQEK